jgi:2-oxoglutarate ferredoxin oxidoreductase subunit alpha
VHDRVPVEHYGRVGGSIHTPFQVLNALKEKIVNKY